MSEDIWKEYRGEVYCYWNAVPFDIKPKLSDENKMPVENKSCDYQGYHYEVKKVPGKAGKQAWYKVVKSPMGKSENHTTTNWDEVERKRQERDTQFEARHKESMEAMNRLITSTINLNDTMCELLQEMRRKT